ncbi:hypothetical protein LSH36_149g03000 [Paralvinella palmiformis]|uniref:Uncharacterized protein n=1 Tax=Paralvinella palmiformis TaxID=53620 RepID=A0AAD9NA28_9ANNE|nr:hypothetical protein LSH36_149g03000 [Paralvinella palmiformis]
MADWDNDGAASQHTVHVTLKGLDNDTYRGTVVLRNLSLIFGIHPAIQRDDDLHHVANMSEPIPGSPGHPEDPTGASYYVIAVVLVYGMSIVMLIASHIKRKHQKLIEDRQIDKYLREFQVVREKSSRDSYKNLKRSIMAKLNMNTRNPTYKTLSHTILPMIAVGLPAISDEGIPDIDVIPGSGLRRGSLQASLFRHVHSSLNGSRPRRASDFDIHWRHLNGLQSHVFREGSVESNDSFHGRRSGSNSRSLPSTIEERASPSISNEMSTVIEISEDDSPQSKVTTDMTPTETTSANSRQSPRVTPIDRQQNERCYYKPISISKACRVYEIPRNTPTELMTPGGVHVALPGGAVFNYKKLSPKSSRSHKEEDDLKKDKGSDDRSNFLSVSDLSPRGIRHNEEDHSNVIGRRTAESPIMKRSPDRNDNNLLILDNNSKADMLPSPAGSPLPSPRRRILRLDDVQSLKEPQSSKSKLYERRMTKRTSTDGTVTSQSVGSRDHDMSVSLQEETSTDKIRSPSPRQQVVVSHGKSLHIDVPTGVHQIGGRLSPHSAALQDSGHSVSSRRSSWSSSDQSGQRTKNENGQKRSTFLVPPSDSPVTKLTPDSSEFCSETSSESEEVWSAMRQRVSSSQLETPTTDCEVSSSRPSYSDFEYRGTGSTPLLTPKESRKLDFSRDSRSASPAYSQSSDNEKHVHHVTSV